MIGLKLLFSRYSKHKIILIISLLLMVGALAAVMVFHADIGAESTEPGDYMFCKIMGIFSAVLCADLPVLFMVQEMQGSRFMRAIPCAEKMYRFGIPVFSAVTTFAWFAVILLAYSVFILATGRDIANIADIIVPAAAMGFVFAIVMCCLMTLRYGAVAFFAYYLPFLFVMDILGGFDNGFGIPLWLAVLLFLAAFGASLGVDLIIAGLAYSRGNFRELTYKI